MGTDRNAVAAFLLFAALAAVGIWWRSGTNSASRTEELLHFDGVIDNSSLTYDPVLSDLYVRASEALKLGDAKTAEAIYRDVIAKYPDDPAGYSALATSLYFQRRFDEAKHEYLRALDLDSKSASALFGLGSVAYEEAQYIEAREHLKNALKFGNDDQACHRLLGMVYDQIGDRKNAVLHYQRAVELSGAAAEEWLIDRLDALRNAGEN